MSNNLINLNTATEEELIELPGIAKGLAARIVQYREKVHPFEEVIELASVPGISERMVRELEGQVSISANGSKTDVGSTVVEQAESVVEEEMADDIADTDVPIEDVPLAEVDVDADMGEAIDSANIEESINRIPEVTLVSSLGEVVAEHAPIEEAPAEPAMDS
ncbi:MAG: competence ComEA-like helix-hairpin-helix protein, partial [Cellvibrionaceae bacterium]